MIATIKLIKNPLPHIVTSFVFVLRTLKVYYLSKFQMYNTVLLTVVAILHIRSPEFSHLYNWKFVPLYDISPSSSPILLFVSKELTCFKICM